MLYRAITCAIIAVEVLIYVLRFNMDITLTPKETIRKLCQGVSVCGSVRGPRYELFLAAVVNEHEPHVWMCNPICAYVCACVFKDHPALFASFSA